MAKNGNIKGLDALIKKLNNAKSDLYKDVDAITEGNAQEIALKAKGNAPKNFGNLAASIQVEPDGKLTYKIVVNAEYSGFVEFGTGNKVQIPNELKEQAAKFKSGNSGTFKEGLQAIKDWCRAKGIPEEAAYPILVTLITEGQTAQPFLYPAFVSGKKQYIEDLKGLLDNEFKKILQ